MKLPILVARSVAEAKSHTGILSQSYDSYIRQEEVSCRKGCSNCCYNPVKVTLLEGLRIYDYLCNEGLWSSALKSTLKIHAEKVQGLSLEIWKLGMIECPFLKDSLCKIYKARPFVCHITYSVGAPEDCHPHSVSNTGILPRTPMLQAQESLETPLLARHSLAHFRVPLSVALLYADKISKDEISLEDCRQALWQFPE